MPKGRELHDDALVIDGLVYHCDGDVSDLKAGGINALNITTCFFEADFAEACQEISRWHGILNAPGSPWLQIETAAGLHRIDVQAGDPDHGTGVQLAIESGCGRPTW